jgi:hypothetical protein
MFTIIDITEIFIRGTVRDFYKRGQYIFQIIKGDLVAILLEDKDILCSI